MAVFDTYHLTLRHPLTARGAALVQEYTEMREQRDGFIFHRSLDDGEVSHAGDVAGGSVQVVEFRRTLDYSREERRAAKRSGQKLQPNQFKSIIPEGWRVLPPEADDPAE